MKNFGEKKYKRRIYTKESKERRSWKYGRRNESNGKRYDSSNV